MKNLILEENTTAIEEETLTDGSKVYNVIIHSGVEKEVEIGCINKAQAEQLMELLENCSYIVNR